MKSVLIIERHERLRKSYINLINNSNEFKVIGDFENYESALKNISGLNPEIVLTNIDFSGMSGIEGIAQIKKLLPNTKIMVICSLKNSKYVFEALREGAIGYITKNSSQKKINDALTELDQGGAPLSISISRMVVESFQNKKFDQLTSRENDVVSLLSQGKSYANIADELYVSLNTIKGHVKNIYEKLHVSNKNEVIKLVNSQNFYNL
ncbi:response regulator transcription factor [Aquimarina sp. 2201CG5-10]|uniref:response regulator transcription factor n=1 Tax=Aquimarina callyspongiae TaxID=3098150 RepID=UPI002AB34F20|nr:response regulator transcription factor [Aquimarina sp. 2201CG5-10]MDY8134790.1 response regulator transcription factor [Aquimarina sp. 2201CG5-10]